MSGWFNMNTSCMLPQLHTYHPDEVPAAGDEPGASGQGMAKFLPYRTGRLSGL